MTRLKYAKLVRRSNSGPITIVQLQGGEFTRTKRGELIQVIDGEVTQFLKPGSWALMYVKAKKKAQPTPNYNFTIQQQPSTPLSKIVGTAPLSRTEAVKKVWSFVKKHELQDTANKRIINMGNHPLTLDVFKKPRVNMFEITKMLNDHLKPVKK